MKLIKTRKDLFFVFYCIFWLLTGCGLVYFLAIKGIHIDPYLINTPILTLFGVICLFKHFTKFGEWLEKDL